MITKDPEMIKKELKELRESNRELSYKNKMLEIEIMKCEQKDNILNKNRDLNAKSYELMANNANKDIQIDILNKKNERKEKLKVYLDQIDDITSENDTLEETIRYLKKEVDYLEDLNKKIDPYDTLSHIYTRDYEKPLNTFK